MKSVSLMNEWERYWKIWCYHHQHYQKLMEELGEALGVQFEAKYAPWYLAGNWERTENKLFICGLNLGSPPKPYGSWHHWQSQQTGFDLPFGERSPLNWNQHLQFSKQCFLKAHTDEKSHRHYSSLARLVCAYYGIEIPKKNIDRYRFPHDHAVFGEILPFYSKNTNLSLKPQGKRYLESFWGLTVDFIKQSQFDVFVLMGKQGLVYESDLFYELIKPQTQIQVELNRKGKQFLPIVQIGNIRGVITPFLD